MKIKQLVVRHMKYGWRNIFTQKKTLIAQLYGLELRGFEISLSYNGDRLTLFYMDKGNEDSDLIILYSFHGGFSLLNDIFPHNERMRNPFIEKVSLSTAAEIIKKTWKRRDFPSRKGPWIFVFFSLIAATSFIQTAAIMTLWVVRWWK